MAPHTCELLVKTILTDKNFNTAAFLKSGFNDFWNQIDDYLKEFNKPQKGGFFGRAKYADCKGIIAALKKVVTQANSSHFRPDKYPIIDHIFCIFLHPQSPHQNRSAAVDLFLSILLLIPDDSIGDFQYSLRFLIPWMIFAKDETLELLKKTLYPNSEHIINESSYAPSTPDEAEVTVKNVLDFIYKNWDARTKLCINILFDNILCVAYHDAAEQTEGLATLPYGFKNPPECVHYDIMNFLKQMVENEVSLTPLLKDPKQFNVLNNGVISKVAHIRKDFGDFQDFITCLKLLTTILSSSEYFKYLVMCPEGTLSHYGDIIFDIVTSATMNQQINSGFIVTAQSLIEKYIKSLLMDVPIERGVAIFRGLVTGNKGMEFALSLFTMTLCRHIIMYQERRPEVMKMLTDTVAMSTIFAAAASYFAVILATTSFPIVFKINVEEAKVIAKNFIDRKKRNKQETPFDNIGKNFTMITESPSEYVRTTLESVVTPLRRHDRLLKNIKIPPLEGLSDDEIIDGTVFFLDSFSVYREYPELEQRQLCFAPIYSFADKMSKLLLIPPGIKYDGTAPFQLCGNAMFFAILNQADTSIRDYAFQILSRILNLTEMSPFLDSNTLSQWYTSLVLMVLSANPRTRLNGFKEAFKTVQHGFTGSTILTPVLMAAVEEDAIPLGEHLVSFLASMPFFHVDCPSCEHIVPIVDGIISKNPEKYISGWSSILRKPGTDMRRRAINKLKEKHQASFLKTFREHSVQDPNDTEDEKYRIDYAEWPLLLPAYSALIADEVANDSPDPSVIADFLDMVVQAFDDKSIEAVMTFRSLLMYWKVFTELIPDRYSKTICTIIEKVCSISEITGRNWSFQLIKLIGDILIVSYSVVKTSDSFVRLCHFLYTNSRRSSKGDEAKDEKSTKSKTGFEYQVWKLMEITLDMLTKHYGRFPAPSSMQFLTNTSSSIVGDAKSSHFYAIGKGLYHARVADGAVKLSAAFPSGQFRWDFEPAHEALFRSEEAPQIDVALSSQSAEIAPATSLPAQSELAMTIDGIVADFELDGSFDAIPDDDELSAALDAIEETSNSFEPAQVCVRSPEPPKGLTNTAAAALVACGRVSMSKYDKITRIDAGKGASTIQHVQCDSTRFGIKIGVVFVGEGVEDQNRILATTYEQTTPHFREFLTGLGWPIDLQSHVGYFGGLDAKNSTNGNSSIFYSDFMHEVMFHVGPLLPNDLSNEQQIYKKRHIGNDHVHIIWSTNTRDYNTSTISSQFNQAHIVIYPLQTALFRVDIFWRDGVEWFGPLRHSIVVSKRALPSLVRETAVTAMVSYYQKQSQEKYPMGDIDQNIGTLLSECRVQAMANYGAVQDLMELSE